MKKIFIGTGALLLAFILWATPVSASPTNDSKGENNPQVVAFYKSGIHAIAAKPVFYVVGTDLVTKRGKSGNIQQWYTQADGHGIHSVWNILKKGSCSEGGTLIKQAYPTWGDYLTPGADYCVHNNTF